MEDSLRQSMLLDFYGELLTGRQRECFELHYSEDFSLSEIAEQLGVTRQGVWDNIRRAQAAMESMEEKTGLIRRYQENRQALEKLREQMDRLAAVTAGEAREIALRAVGEIDAIISRG